MSFHRWDKAQAHEQPKEPDPSLGYITKTGRVMKARPGPKSSGGEWRQCETCGKDIYVKPYQIKAGLGRHCRECTERPRDFRQAIRGMVSGLKSSIDTRSIEEMFDRTVKVLYKYLEKDPEQTVRMLVHTKTFTADDIINGAMGMMIEEYLRSCPEFEETEPGSWRYKGEASPISGNVQASKQDDRGVSPPP